MGENLIIVESPAKAKTIGKFLGKDYVVKSSKGHIRDLSEKDLSIDVENNFEPKYVIPADKRAVVSELKAAAANADTVYLASDEDREGEAISWHLFQTLGLDDKNTKRIAFHEITKGAVDAALDNPRRIDMDLVMAQQARRVLDRLVGFELSPVLWRKIQPKLSAGRVQSVALRLIVDKEREIIAFKPQRFFKVTGIFIPEGLKGRFNAICNGKFTDPQQVLKFLEQCEAARFAVSGIEKKEMPRTPAAPFTTSTLQQEASRRLGFSVKQTMAIAQKLYESGLITYMRTDSTNLSTLALGTAKAKIIELYGEEYSRPRQYKTKVRGAQEAHEAIRPTFIANQNIEGTLTEKKLYNLIWKRTAASQMADAKISKTAVTISADKLSETFSIDAENVLFDGFLKVYLECRDDEGSENDEQDIKLPELKVGQVMNRVSITALERYTTHPQRYTEASLVKKMEELEIGRPSTYAPTISTLFDRGYVVKDNRDGVMKDFAQMALEGNSISESVVHESVGGEKGKLFPENIGIQVVDYLKDHFPSIIDYSFTADMEQDLDSIAEGKKVWYSVLKDFYVPFHDTVTEISSAKVSGDKMSRELGVDPVSGKKVTTRMGRYGAIVQMGENEDTAKKYASLQKGQLIETITLEDALSLLRMPRDLGLYKDEPILVNIGKFGPYIKVGAKRYISLPKDEDPYSVTAARCGQIIDEDSVKQASRDIMSFDSEDIHVLNGRYGPYIKQGKNNYKIPRGTKAETLTLEVCKEIISKALTEEKPAKKK